MSQTDDPIPEEAKEEIRENERELKYIANNSDGKAGEYARKLLRHKD